MALLVIKKFQNIMTGIVWKLFFDSLTLPMMIQISGKSAYFGSKKLVLSKKYRSAKMKVF